VLVVFVKKLHFNCMAISQFVRARFEKRFGCTIETAAANLGTLSRMVLLRNRSIKANEMVGRGYVHFGKGVNADQMDKESRQILSRW